MNPRRSPGRVLGDHAENQVADVLGKSPSADGFSNSGNESPVETEAGLVPAHHGIWGNDNQRALPFGPEAFLRNHREAIAAMDFFTVPTITFGMLYCFFVISHDRRRILHFNVTKHPSSMWVVQQLRQAFPFDSVPRFLIFDRDAKYGLEVPIAIRSMGIDPIQTSYQSPWQNGVAERWVESCRRDLLDHVIAINEQHLRRLLTDYVRYYQDDRTHLGLAKETPVGRVPSMVRGPVVSHRRLGDLHYRYDRAAA